MHFLLRYLSDGGLIRRIYTQNIDGLESKAGKRRDVLSVIKLELIFFTTGINKEVVVEMHGSLMQPASCLVCSAAYSSERLDGK